MKDTVLKNGEVYVVTMYRYGNYDDHSYLLCVADNYTLAIKYEDDERLNRGNKYYGEITMYKLNTPKEREVVRRLEDHPLLQ